MPAAPRPGTTLRQEFSLGNAEDLARYESKNASIKVKYGSFSNVLKTLETTPVEPSARENKYYVSGIGNVLTVDLETGEREELISLKR